MRLSRNPLRDAGFSHRKVITPRYKYSNISMDETLLITGRYEEGIKRDESNCAVYSVG
jgi:hypothetical protein